MKVTRRDFLGSATALAGGAWSYRFSGLLGNGVRPEHKNDCVLLDLASDCVLRESLEGCRSALGDQHHGVMKDAIDARWCGRTVIVPGVGTMDCAVAQKLQDCVAAGNRLLLESVGGFLSSEEFAAQQETLRRYFDIAVKPPIDLWPRKSGDHKRVATGSRAHGRNPDRAESIPYVTYVWPRRTSVRDFSRVISVSARDGDVIGSIGTLPVALKKRLGKGTLIFLGSPLGPALRAGDAEAHSWLRSVTAGLRA